MTYDKQTNQFAFSKAVLFENVQAEIHRLASIPGNEQKIAEITLSDKPAILRHLSLGLSEIVSMFSGFFDDEFGSTSITNDNIVIDITFTDNMNGSMALPLGSFIEDYLIQYSISKWLNSPFNGKDEIALSIFNCLRSEKSSDRSSVLVVFNSGRAIWEISVNKQGLIDNAKAELSRIAYEKNAPKLIATNRGQKRMQNIFMSGIYDLLKVFAAYLIREFSDYEIEETVITFAIKGGDNIDNSIAFTLTSLIDNYIETYIIESWIGENTGKLDQLSSKIRSCLYHRKGSAARQVRPLL